MADQPNPIELQKHLKGVDYPASRSTLVEHARSNGAPDDVVDRLQTIDDREYEGPSGVVKEFSKG